MARGAIIGAAACGLVWAAAGGAAAQELQAGQMMTQAEADRLEALQADLDREEAEDADTARRDEERRRREREALEEELLADLVDDRTEEERLEAERLAACRAELLATKKLMIDQITQQYALMERQLRAGGGPNIEEAIAGLLRGRDQAIEAMTSGECS
ncbi:hypothetical protein [Brevundimonas sp.]|uniref:hypothetical protein n=1 Tax=Brevundimonas sp. TaxID=1871086 RepID=UPI002FC882FF